MNKIQELFEMHGYDLEENNNMAELCDDICDRIINKLETEKAELLKATKTAFKDILEYREQFKEAELYYPFYLEQAIKKASK